MLRRRNQAGIWSIVDLDEMLTYFVSKNLILHQSQIDAAGAPRHVWGRARPRYFKLTDPVVGSWEVLAVSMQGKKVVKLPECPNWGFPHTNGMMIEFSRENCQVQVFDVPYGLKLTGAGKDPELAQAYPKGLDGAA
jgi:hypothetical protein